MIDPTTLKLAFVNARTARPPSEDGFWNEPMPGQTPEEAAYRQGVEEAVRIIEIDLGFEKEPVQGQEWETQRLADEKLTERFFGPVGRPHLVIVRDRAGATKVFRFEDIEFAGMIAKDERRSRDLLESQSAVQRMIEENDEIDSLGLQIIEITDGDLSRAIGQLVNETLTRRDVDPA